jgi:hypothetical protein
MSAIIKKFRLKKKETLKPVYVTANDCIAKYGLPNVEMERSFMALYKVPESIAKAIPALPKRIYCNYDLIAPLEQALRNVINRGLQDEIKTWDGCFNIRNIRGGSTWSLHSWGIAIDINAAWNGLGKTPQMSAALVKCFTDAGFHWGGAFTRKDGMHFQLAFLPK